MRPKLLFVDDDENWLNAIRRALRGKTAAWDLHFAAGASEALHRCENEPFDVVVSDYCMPGVNGGQLLRRLGELRPEMMQVLCSCLQEGGPDGPAAIVAGEFIQKTAPIESLVAVIERALSMQALVRRRAVDRLLRALAEMPYATDLDVHIRAERAPNGELRATAEIVCPTLELRYRVPVALGRNAVAASSSPDGAFNRPINASCAP
jgi:DNA-binding NtrC family response regulator